MQKILAILFSLVILGSAHAVTNPTTVKYNEDVTLKGKVVVGFQYGKYNISKGEFEYNWGTPQFLILDTPITVIDDTDPQYSRKNVRNIYIISAKNFSDETTGSCFIMKGSLTQKIKLKRDQDVNIIADSVVPCNK